MKKLLTITILLILTALIFQACSRKEFNDSLTCQQLSSRLESEISAPRGEFEEYSTEELNFLFSDSELYDDACVIYSVDSTDICELGVLHASSKENAKKLYEDAKLYIKSLQEQKSEFLRNYSPAELTKLNSAEARCYGNYVIFTVAEQSNGDEVFKKAEMILSK